MPVAFNAIEAPVDRNAIFMGVLVVQNRILVCSAMRDRRAISIVVGFYESANVAFAMNDAVR